MSQAEEASALYAALREDSDVASLVAQYDSAPAVFTTRLVPEDADRPYIHLQEVSSVPFDTKDNHGRDSLWQAGVYVDETGSEVELRTLTDAVDAALHRITLDIADGTLLCLVTGVLLAPTGENVVGRIVQVRLVYQS